MNIHSISVALFHLLTVILLVYVILNCRDGLRHLRRLKVNIQEVIFYRDLGNLLYFLIDLKILLLSLLLITTDSGAIIITIRIGNIAIVGLKVVDVSACLMTRAPS